MEGCGPCDLSLKAAITTETCSSYVNFTVFSIPPLEADISHSSAKDLVAIVVSRVSFRELVTNVYFPEISRRRWDAAGARVRVRTILDTITTPREATTGARTGGPSRTVAVAARRVFAGPCRVPTWIDLENFLPDGVCVRSGSVSQQSSLGRPQLDKRSRARRAGIRRSS